MAGGPLSQPKARTTRLVPDTAPPKLTGQIDDWIGDMVGALTDPIIVYPGTGWEKDLPQPIKNELPLHRLAHLMKCNQGQADPDEASDADALLYLYPASMAFPLGEQWTRIYLYLATRVLGDKIPEDIREDKLSRYDAGELRSLKQWIKKRQKEARRTRREPVDKEPEAQPRAETRAEKYEQVKFF